jgi:ATP-dependent Lhr-like helicase
MSSVSTAFELLHPGVQRQLWRMGWHQLNPLQVRSIQHLVENEGHAVLTAGTAAGKTEAAFLPILSVIAGEPAGSVRAIYIGPLKALINDQFGRLEELCSYLEVPVHRWHGDVGAAAKRKLVKEPGGVLLITPESLESLFVNRSQALPSLFGGLRFVVIDELHAFLGNERGLHLRSLLYRVATLCKKRLRLVGLSATIGEPRIAAEYLDREQPERVAILAGDSTEPEIRLKIHVYPDAERDDVTRAAEDAGVAARPTSQSTPDPRDDDDQVGLHDHERRLAADLVRHCQGSVNLVFANTRDDVELFGDACGRIAAESGVADPFMVHHGSLSADVRHDAETTMKATSARAGSAATTFCTSTLEMGIDIGGVSMVGQIGAPSSVASIKQRLGRSGRRAGTARVLRMYLRAKAPDEHSDLFDRLHLELVQSVAVTELLLERWVEPAVHRACDLSTLAQQTISIIAERGGARAEQIYQTLAKKGAFRDVEPALFGQTLRQLGAKDVVEQTPEGDLILGLVGEGIRKDKSFYAAFVSEEALTVLHEGRRIGTIDAPPRPGDHLILARRRWRAVDVDEGNLVVYVVPARGFKRSPFKGRRGDLHPTIVARMHQVLTGELKPYPYLDSTGARLLSGARAVARSAGLANARLLALSPGRTAIMTWTGSRTQRTLLAMLRSCESVVSDETIAIVAEHPAAACRDQLRRIAAEQCIDPLKLAPLMERGRPDKYDHLLNDQLLDQRCIRRDMDAAGAAELSANLLDEHFGSSHDGNF